MEEIYKEYSLLVYRYLYGLTNDIELSEELMQETFYSATKNINKFKGNSKISVWLCQIAKNKWKDYIKKHNQIKSVSLDYIDENSLYDENILDQVNDKNEIMQLYKSIHKLDKDVREVFYLRIKRNFSFKEIAEIIGKSEEWTRVNFYRGKLKLREDLLNHEK